MPRFIIEETTQVEIVAPSAQEALDIWLQEGELAPGYGFLSVDDRIVYDDGGIPQQGLRGL